jgi:hypothetical protein
MFSTVKNDLQMKRIPFFFWKEFAQIHFCLQYIFAIGEFPALSESMNVGVDWKGWFTKRLADHDTCRFSTDSWQSLQRLKILGNFAGVLVNQDFR